jgi:putative transcriptional regulator
MKNRLHVLRAEGRLTQGALADALGVSRQTINAIETGKYDPSLPLAFKIAALFGERIEDIFQPEGEPAAAPGSGNATRAPLTAAGQTRMNQRSR